jgi:hypothetical protein
VTGHLAFERSTQLPLPLIPEWRAWGQYHVRSMVAIFMAGGAVTFSSLTAERHWADDTVLHLREQVHRVGSWSRLRPDPRPIPPRFGSGGIT